MTAIEIRVDDLSSAATRELIVRHLVAMHETSPPESVHALGLEALADPTVTVWSAWVDGELAGIGALKVLDDGDGELKSMRVVDRFRGRGIGRAVLERIEAEAAARGIGRLWLETGSANEFLPARGLYTSAGYVECAPFGDYVDDPLSVFMTREILSTAG